MSVRPNLPGDHLLLVSSRVRNLRIEGWSLRDTLLIFAFDGIRFAYLYRRPIEGQLVENVLRHGTGGLNIDACRKPWMNEEERLDALPGSMPKANSSIGTFETRDRSGEDPLDAQSSLGRWPTNVVLVHHPDCSEECVEDCLAHKMDVRSGILKSGRGAIKHSTSRGYQGMAYGKENRPEGTAMISYGDIGGASRYYPQFRNYQELIAWLHKLVFLPPRR